MIINIFEIEALYPLYIFTGYLSVKSIYI